MCFCDYGVDDVVFSVVFLFVFLMFFTALRFVV